MPDAIDDRPSKLIPFFSVYAPQTFRRTDGQPLKKRALLNIVKRKKLPLIYAGGEPLVDPAQCDEVLRAQAKHKPIADEQPVHRGPGRPRLLVR